MQQLLLGLELGLAAHCYLQPLQRLLQRLLLAQQLHPLPGMGALLLLPELPLQLSDPLLPAEHRLGGLGQFFCH